MKQLLLLACALTLPLWGCKGRQDAASDRHQPNANIAAVDSPKTKTPMQEQPWKMIIAFSDTETPSEDWNEAYSKFRNAFKGTGVLVRYAGPDVDSVMAPTSEIIELKAFREAYQRGFMALESGRTPEYLGDHSGFYDPDQMNPITQAEDYFAKRD